VPPRPTAWIFLFLPLRIPFSELLFLRPPNFSRLYELSIVITSLSKFRRRNHHDSLPHCFYGLSPPLQGIPQERRSASKPHATTFETPLSRLFFCLPPRPPPATVRLEYSSFFTPITLFFTSRSKVRGPWSQGSGPNFLPQRPSTTW